ncbi:MAG: DUF3566 domain-containing protein [Nocardioidaceae bacterium]
MNDRRTDETAPLAPRRPLTGPPGAPPYPPPAPQGGPATPPPQGGPGPAARSSGGSSLSEQTVAMPRIDESGPEHPAPSAHSSQALRATEAAAGADVTAPRTMPPPGSAPGPTTPGAAATVATSTTRTGGPPRARTARLRLVRVDPWSVMKMAFALSIALAIVMVVAVAIVWSVLGAAGVWDAINSSVQSLLSDSSSSTFDITSYVGMSRVVGLTLVIGAADVVLLTAIATLAAFLYNLVAAMLGGLEVTLAEDR